MAGLKFLLETVPATTSTLELVARFGDGSCHVSKGGGNLDYDSNGSDAVKRMAVVAAVTQGCQCDDTGPADSLDTRIDGCE